MNKYIVNFSMKKDNTITIGVVGVGHLGNFHLTQLKQIHGVKISGIYDSDKVRLNEMSKKHNVNNFRSITELFNVSDAVIIVTPTITHYSIASEALQFGCHVFIEKPITNTINQAESLIKKGQKLNKIIQVGHIERFNPAFNKLNSMNINPQFIESHRLSQFNSRSIDIPVILDLMIHDLDIILSMINSDIINIQANGVKVVSSSIDIANARIEFANGCIANLSASRISQKDLRKMRLFQTNEYITLDFKNQILEHYLVKNDASDYNTNNVVIELGNKKYIQFHIPQLERYDALRKELEHFVYCIKNNKKPITDVISATRALELAIQIQDIIN